MISTGTGFKILSRDSIDERFILSKDQMLNINEAVQPENYFCVCTDDSMLYVYNVNNPVDAETGKFRKVSSNESVDPSIFQKINDDTLITEDKTIVGAINELKTGVSSISVPTQVSQLTNDSGYITSDEVDLIKEYNPDETYNEGQICLYNNYVWLCKTITTGAFEETKWEKQTDDITELDLNTIKTFLGLTPEQLETMADIISSEIRTDKVFSSSETYTRIDNALKEAKQYCLSQLAQKSAGSFKIVSSTTEVTDGNYLYLIMNAVSSKYDIFALVDGNVEKLTTVDVNLDDYFTKTEIEADFLKKTDADGKYATITALDGKVDKTDIVDNLTSSDTDKPLSANQGKVLKYEVDLKANDADVVKKTDIVDDLTSTDTDKPLSANQGKVLKDEVDLKANDSEVVKRTDITTTINSTSTDNELPTAKSVFDTIKNNGLIWQGVQSLQNSQESSVFNYCKSNFISALICGFRLEPRDESGYFNSCSVTVLYCLSSVNYGWILGLSDKRDTPMAFIQIINGNIKEWQRVCTTTVADVGVTTITPVDSNITGTIEYTVKNGVCYVSLFNVKTTANNDGMSISTTMPKPAINSGSVIVTKGNRGNIGFIYINKGTTQLKADFWISGISGSCSFSYPVAE